MFGEAMLGVVESAVIGVPHPDGGAVVTDGRKSTRHDRGIGHTAKSMMPCHCARLSTESGGLCRAVLRIWIDGGRLRLADHVQLDPVLQFDDVFRVLIALK